MKLVSTTVVAALLAAAQLGFSASSSFAQDVGIVQSQVLIVDPERLFEQTNLGQVFLNEVQKERDELIAQNSAIQSKLEAEELALTAKREEVSPEEFRKMADAFDEKVQEIRRSRDRRARDLERKLERAPAEFMRQVEPVLVEIMRAADARVVVDARNVLLRSDAVDITNLAIARVDALFPRDQDSDSATDADGDQTGTVAE